METVYANEYAPRDGILRLHCLCHEERYVKADAYLMELNGTLWLIDGGMSGSLVTRDYLYALRRVWLQAAGVPQESGGKLKLNWIVSHFHVDHVAATIESIIPDGAFEFERIYLPPDSALDPIYHEYGTDGDTKYRPLLAAALKEYGSGREEIVDSVFGAENIQRFSAVGGKLRFTIYPPPGDGGAGKRLQYMIDNYYGGDLTNKMVATAAVNSCCPWLHIAYGKRTFLFTGDQLKRKALLDKESADEMLRTYGSMIGKVDVVKFLHHGQKRDNAVSIVMSFDPEHIIVSCKSETATAALNAAYPGMRAQVHNCAQSNIIFSTDGEYLTVNS